MNFKVKQLIIPILLLLTVYCLPDNLEVGYRVGEVQSYKKLKEYKGSALY
jgi:hypothetical protein